mmetsp:Transcript_2965/g.4773  ORF Transcript_2965/g.4773 Transcript_2965/m.4773 type:complete len:87 (-) Transcript_2965:461-721(-)
MTLVHHFCIHHFHDSKHLVHPLKWHSDGGHLEIASSISTATSTVTSIAAYASKHIVLDNAAAVLSEQLCNSPKSCFSVSANESTFA